MIVKEHSISINWLLNEILGGGKTNYQITKIDDEQLNTFLLVLYENQFPMPDGTNVLRWIKDRLVAHHDQVANKMSEEWEKTRQRYRYIIQRIDQMLVKSSKNITVSNEIPVCSNELTISF